MNSKYKKPCFDSSENNVYGCEDDMQASDLACLLLHDDIEGKRLVPKGRAWVKCEMGKLHSKYDGYVK